MMKVRESFRYVIILAIVLVHRNTAAPSSSSIAPSSSSSCTIMTNNTLDCSNLGLTAIPNDIPNTTLSLNLSSNEIVHLDENSFAYCRQLKVLDLSKNKISNIHPRTFKSSHNLTTIILKENQLEKFDKETFVDLHKLESLDLSKNSIKLHDSFIVQASLKELILDHCNIEEITNEAFMGISQLDSLSMEGNKLDNFDSTPFEHFTMLTKLRMHNLSQENILELCDKLESIDTINFDGFNVSCFILLNQKDFSRAVVGNDPPLQLPVLHETTPRPSTTTTLTTTTIEASTTSTSIPSTMAETSKSIEDTTEFNGTKTVDVDDATIQYMLMGILAVTLMGIAIGLICRADILGIKTKMCRSNKSTNRRKPEDSVSPFEEIPLNNISASNGNGKASE